MLHVFVFHLLSLMLKLHVRAEVLRGLEIDWVSRCSELLPSPFCFPYNFINGLTCASVMHSVAKFTSYTSNCIIIICTGRTILFKQSEWPTFVAELQLLKNQRLDTF